MTNNNFALYKMNVYERVKNALKKKYEFERSGDQTLYADQTKLL